jgi:hypothetical protein
MVGIDAVSRDPTIVPNILEHKWTYKFISFIYVFELTI